MLDVETASRAELIAHIDALEARLNAYGEDDRAARRLRLMTTLKLAATPAAMLEILMDGHEHSRAAMMAHLYGEREDGGASKTLDVFLVKVRAATLPHGIVISTIWGAGWRITQGLDVLRALCAGDPATDAAAAHPVSALDQLQTLDLPRRERQVLDALIASGVRRISTDRMMDHLYGDDPDGGAEAFGSAFSHVSKLRQRIQPLGWLITSSRNLGYRLERRPA